MNELPNMIKTFWVEVPLAGGAGYMKLAECQTAEAAAEVVRILLSPAVIGVDELKLTKVSTCT